MEYIHGIPEGITNDEERDILTCSLVQKDIGLALNHLAVSHDNFLSIHTLLPICISIHGKLHTCTKVVLSTPGRTEVYASR